MTLFVFTKVLRRQCSSLLVRRRRPFTTQNHHNSLDDKSYKRGMEQLKKTNPILHKMAPTRGGTELPDAKFLAIFAVVGSAGFYAWFIDPPTKHKGDEEKEIS